MWKANFFLKILILCFFSTTVSASFLNFFQNFLCGIGQNVSPQKCEIIDIHSTNQLKTKFEYFDKYDFTYEGTYENRSEISNYNEFVFKNSMFEKFPTGSFGHFSHVISITAQKVRLSTLNRDSFTSFTSLEVLDLSHNNIQSLESNILSYMKSLRFFNISHNQINILNKDVFDEYGKNLTDVDLSHNHIKVIDTNLFEDLGKTGQISLYLSFNNIEKISIYSTNKIQFQVLDFCCNNMKEFEFDNGNSRIRINTDVNQSKIKHLILQNNSLTTVKIFTVESLDISHNINLKDISLKFDALKKLEASNVSSAAINYNFLQNANQLTELDLSNTNLETLKFETFSEMTLLEDLNLENTGLSHIEHGMFWHQKNLKNFDISYNKLGSFDIEMLSNMKSLRSLDISGNNLTNFNDISNFKKNFVNFTLIGIEENNWNCSYLARIVKEFGENGISIKQPIYAIKNESHVMGIGCRPVSQQENLSSSPDTTNDLVLQKLTEIIEIKASNSDTSNDLILQKLNEIIKKANKPENSSTNQNQNIGSISLYVLIALNATVLLVIGGMFVHLKLKNVYYRRYTEPSVLARSTNASNMTVEIPFGERKY